MTLELSLPILKMIFHKYREAVRKYINGEDPLPELKEVIDYLEHMLKINIGEIKDWFIDAEGCQLKCTKKTIIIDALNQTIHVLDEVYV